MALLIWRVINSELARLMDKEPGAGMHEEYSARFGTYAVARQRPSGMHNTKTDVCRWIAGRSMALSQPLPVTDVQQTRHGHGLLVPARSVRRISSAWPR